ncbi:MAG: hypothetical protein IPO67_14105 [Deltaproteobacteria bacterium]|nr:hypothetical protein [Deltaproteobacteria bacterium]
MGLDGFTPGAGDLALGVETFTQITTPLNVLAGNLTCGETTWPGGRVVQRGGLNVGIVGVVGADEAAGTQGACAVSDPVAAAKAAAASLGDVDLLIALHTGGASLSAKLAEAVPGLDFVLDGKVGASFPEPRPLAGGQVFELGAGGQGKKLGVLSLELTEGATAWDGEAATGELERRITLAKKRVTEAEAALAGAADTKSKDRLAQRLQTLQKQVVELEAQLAALAPKTSGPTNRFSVELLELSAKVPDHPPTQALVAATLAQLNGVAAQPAAAQAPSRAFAGSEACRACHPAAFTQWSTTPHARAYASLEAVSRANDRDCASCHITGAFHPDGPQGPEGLSPTLQNVGCESCHGPGLQHSAAPADHPMRAEVAPEVCTSCHDGDRDGGRFDPAVYRPKVLHGGGG